MRERRLPKFKMALTGGASLFALAFIQPAMAQQLAQADQPSASTSGGLEEIIVTARRKEERAQAVPIAMNTFAPAALETQHVMTYSDLEGVVPALNTCCGKEPNSSGGGQQWERGVPGVIAYWAGAPVDLGNPASYFDLATFSALKGPQGTLFGLSTDGGAIVLEPKKPTNAFEGYVKVEIGNYGHVLAEGILNVPVIEDKLMVRFGGVRRITDGYDYIVSTNQYLGNENWTIGRLGVTIRPLDDFENTFFFSSNSWRDNGTPMDTAYLYPKGGIAGTIFGFANLVANQGAAPYGSFYVHPGNPGVPAYSNSGQQYVLNNTTTWDFNDHLTIKNILAYLETRPGPSISDNGSVPYPLLLGWNPILKTQGVQPTRGAVTEELQALGTLFDDKFSYTIGTFNQKTYVYSTKSIAYSTALGGTTGSSTGGQTMTNAIYGQGTYDLSFLLDGLSITGGMRYSWDKIYNDVIAYSSLGVRTSFRSFLQYSHNPSYSWSLDWQIDPKHLVYITNSKGYSRGGFNTTANLPLSLVKIGPESLNNFEIGTKSDFDIYGVKLRTNVSLYGAIYSQIQVGNFVLYQTPVGPNSAYITQNKGQGHLGGADFEITIIPIDDLELHINGNKEVVKYDGNENPWIFAPKTTLTFSGTYHLPMFDRGTVGDISISANGLWESNNCAISTLPYTSNDCIGDMHFMNLAADWRAVLGRAGLDAEIYVTNVLDNHWLFGLNDFGNSLGFDDRLLAPPKMIGASIRYSFGS